MGAPAINSSFLQVCVRDDLFTSAMADDREKVWSRSFRTKAAPGTRRHAILRRTATDGKIPYPPSFPVFFTSSQLISLAFGKRNDLTRFHRVGVIRFLNDSEAAVIYNCACLYCTWPTADNTDRHNNAGRSNVHFL